MWGAPIFIVWIDSLHKQSVQCDNSYTCIEWNGSEGSSTNELAHFPDQRGNDIAYHDRILQQIRTGSVHSVAYARTNLPKSTMEIDTIALGVSGN